MERNKEDRLIIPEELVIRKIWVIRGKKIMLDRDLAELYEVKTSRLREAGKKKH